MQVVVPAWWSVTCRAQEFLEPPQVWEIRSPGPARPLAS